MKIKKLEFEEHYINEKPEIIHMMKIVNEDNDKEAIIFFERFKEAGCCYFVLLSILKHFPATHILGTKPNIYINLKNDEQEILMLNRNQIYMILDFAQRHSITILNQ